MSLKGPKPVHIALLIPTIDQIGGAERQVLLLAKELSARGWKVTLVVLSGDGEAQLADLAPVDFLSLGMRYAWIDPRGWHRFRAFVRKHQPQIIHAHLPHATWFARCFRLVTPIPVVVDTIHTSATGSIGRRLGYRLSDWLSNHVTCVSQSVASSASTAGMVTPPKLTLLPNGVPLPPIVPPRPVRRQSTRSFVWIAVGRLAPVKNYALLLHAFAALEAGTNGKLPNLLIAGDGPEASTLRKLAADLLIDYRVLFVGFEPDIQPLLASADAFVLSSRWEGLPVSLLEAQAASLPVVATDVPGTAEAMLAGQSGLLVPPNDIPALTSAMAEIMSMSESARTAMGEQGRVLVEQSFSMSAITTKWEDLYLMLLEAHPHPSHRG